MKRLLRVIPLVVIAGAIYGVYWYTSRPPTSMLLTGVVTTNHITVSPQITGRVTDLKGQPLRLSAPRIVASNGVIHDEMLRVLATHA